MGTVQLRTVQYSSIWVQYGFMGALWLHMGTVRLHMGAVWLHMGTVRLHMGTVWLRMGTVRLHMGTVWLRMGTVWLHMGTVWLRMGTVTCAAVASAGRLSARLPLLSLVYGLVISLIGGIRYR